MRSSQSSLFGRVAAALAVLLVALSVHATNQQSRFSGCLDRNAKRRPELLPLPGGCAGLRCQSSGSGCAIPPDTKRREHLRAWHRQGAHAVPGIVAPPQRRRGGGLALEPPAGDAIFHDHFFPVGIDFTLDGSELFAADSNGITHRYDWLEKRQVDEFQIADPPRNMSCSPDGRLMVVNDCLRRVGAMASSWRHCKPWGPSMRLAHSRQTAVDCSLSPRADLLCLTRLQASISRPFPVPGESRPPPSRRTKASVDRAVDRHVVCWNWTE